MDLSKYLSPSKGPMQTLTKKPMKLPPRNAMVQLTDPDTGKARKMKPLGQAARRIYRKQILAGTDPAFVLPRELRWQPDGSGGGRIFARPAAEIQKRQAYKSYLSSHQLNNTEQLPGLAGFGLLCALCAQSIDVSIWLQRAQRDCQRVLHFAPGC